MTAVILVSESSGHEQTKQNINHQNCIMKILGSVGHIFLPPGTSAVQSISEKKFPSFSQGNGTNSRKNKYVNVIVCLVIWLAGISGMIIHEELLRHPPFWSKNKIATIRIEVKLYFVVRCTFQSLDPNYLRQWLIFYKSNKYHKVHTYMISTNDKSSSEAPDYKN